jgi:hypothetical protein
LAYILYAYNLFQGRSFEFTLVKARFLNTALAAIAVLAFLKVAYVSFAEGWIYTGGPRGGGSLHKIFFASDPCYFLFTLLSNAAILAGLPSMVAKVVLRCVKSNTQAAPMAESNSRSPRR